jgi:hypothetical protein
MLNKIRKALGATLHRARARRSLQEVLTRTADLSALEDWTRSLTDPTGYYLDCVRYFHSPHFPDELREHRNYFLKDQRGFGEDAFHVMWWMIFCEIRPSRFLEIGVYRGQTLSLASLLQRNLGINGSVTGISPFTASGDSVSRYSEQVDYLADTKANFTHFQLAEPDLVQAFSTEAVAIERVNRESWSAIYIDGNHDYEIARADWELCAAHLLPGGVIVLDDSAMSTAYTPRLFATAGHPGPSQLATEIDSSVFREVLRVGHNRVFQKTA